MNDVPGLISLATIVAVVLLNHDMRLYNWEPGSFDASTHSHASKGVDGGIEPASPAIIEAVDRNTIVHLSITILEALQDQ
jgi:hypothetical protein